jgi:hypothetical protein
MVQVKTGLAVIAGIFEKLKVIMLEMILKVLCLDTNTFILKYLQDELKYTADYTESLHLESSTKSSTSEDDSE